MKEWVVIHKLKSLSSNGLSIRAIAKELGLARNTVRKYLRMEEKQISITLDNPEREKQLAPYRDFICSKLSKYPKLSAAKLSRKLYDAFPELNVSERTIRRYVSQLKKEVCARQPRYYEPVLDMIPGEQCQVDPGELRGVLINGVETTVYFVVFVLSYSRLMHVSVSFNPIDTTEFIRMHDAAFRYFGGCPKEVVYDQTKLVVLKEIYREVELNQQMAEFATHAGYSIRVCEGYDPESKGKVEAGVKYVKHNALYGEEFESREALTTHLADWVDNVANLRLHGTTGQRPKERFHEKEAEALNTYFTPHVVHLSGQWVNRKSDKTGLISWKSNKYSVPMAYQRQDVAVMESNGELVIGDISGEEEIARHTLHVGKGQIIKNNHHYRDLSLHVDMLEREILTQLDNPLAEELLALIKRSSPKIYKDQLAGLRRILSRLGRPTEEQLQRLCTRTKLTATQFETLLEAMQKSPIQQESEEVLIRTGALSRYQELTGESCAYH